MITADTIPPPHHSPAERSDSTPRPQLEQALALKSPLMIAIGQLPLAVLSLWFAAVCLVTDIANPQSIPGVPEPGMILYGQIRNTASGGSLITYGTLRWTLQPLSGSAVTVGVTLTNINDQFSYVVRLPFESVLPGFTPSANTLTLSNTPVTYARSATVNFQSATILAPAIATLTFGPADRGRSERVDLQVTLPFVDTDSNGLDDNWEMAYFGHLGVDSNADPDHDGMKNSAEFKAGTNPNDPQSRFAFINVGPDPLGGIGIRWFSVALNRYTVQRSGDLNFGFTNLVTAIVATPGTNYLRDATAADVGPYFYRLRVE